MLLKIKFLVAVVLEVPLVKTVSYFVMIKHRISFFQYKMRTISFHFNYGNYIIHKKHLPKINR